MCCRRLAELPPLRAGTGKSGGPWPETCGPRPVRMRDGRPWLRISMVTPGNNRVASIAEPIRAILLRGDADLRRTASWKASSMPGPTLMLPTNFRECSADS